MQIPKRTANAIRKFGYARIAKGLELKSRQTVYSWFITLSVPDEHIEGLKELTGIEIK